MSQVRKDLTGSWEKWPNCVHGDRAYMSHVRRDLIVLWEKGPNCARGEEIYVRKEGPYM